MNGDKFSNGQYDGYEASSPVLRAIEIITMSPLPVKGDQPEGEDYEAYCMTQPAFIVWYDPTPEQNAMVMEIAWRLAGPSEDCLIWGGKNPRPQQGS